MSVIKVFVLVVTLSGQSPWSGIRFDSYDDCRAAAGAVFRIMQSGKAECRDVFANKTLSTMER